VGIRANQSTYVHIGSNTVRNTRTAYRAIGTSTGINFIGNVATKGYIGFDIATSSQVVIKGNTTNLPGHAAGQSYDVTYANTCDVLLEDNIFRNSSTYSVNAASGGTGGKSRILGNKIIDSTAPTPIHATGGQHAIERNTVISTRATGTGQPAIIVDGGADGSFVIGNIVSHEGAVAFSKMLDSSAGTHTSVMGNYFDGATVVTSSATDYVGNNFQLGVTPPTTGGGTSGDPGGQIVRTGFSVGVTGSSTTAMTANTMLMRPIRIQKGATVTGLAVNVTTAAASSSIRVGIYAHNATTGLPGSLIQEFTSSTTLDSTATGSKTLAISQALTDATVYWIGIVAQGGGPTVSATDQWDSLLPANAAASGTVASLTVGGVTGALPTSPSTFGTTIRMPNVALAA
ncbi:MAG: hypothetical protein ACXVXP_00380, partial [Mycobacteriaceae bacterium]